MEEEDILLPLTRADQTPYPIIQSNGGPFFLTVQNVEALKGGWVITTHDPGSDSGMPVM